MGKYTMHWATLVVAVAAAQVPTRVQAAEHPAIEAAQAGSSRPAYDGNEPYKIEPCLGPYKIQGLEELAGRWGLKPCEKFKTQDYPRTGRVIFRDLRTGAPVWRITDLPFCKEAHRYADYSGWNCDGSLLVVSSGGEFTRVLDGEFSRELAVAAADGANLKSGVWDALQPSVYYCYSSGRLLKCDILSGQSEELYTASKFESLFADYPNQKFVSLWGVTPDGHWVLGRAGGIQDEGKNIFSARTDGKEFKSARLAEGGIHYGQVMRGGHPAALLSVTATPQYSMLYDFETQSWEKLKRMSHRVIGPNELIAHEAPGGVDGYNWKTQESCSLLHVFYRCEEHVSWCHTDPEWIFASVQSDKAPGLDVLKIRSDGSQTALRLCASGSKYPEFTAYDNNAFAASSPDGTKVQFMSNMFGSIDEYLVVAKDPDPPQELMCEAHSEKLTLSWKAPPLHKEIRGYCVYRGDESGKSKNCMTSEPVHDTHFDLPKPDPAKPCYYAVTAVEHSGLESRYSNEVFASPTLEQWRGDVRIYLEAEAGELRPPLRPALNPARASNGHYIWQTKEGEEGTVKLKVNLPKAGRYFFMGRVSGNSDAAPWTLSIDGKEKIPLKAIVPETGWEWLMWKDGAQAYGANLDQGAHELTLGSSHKHAALDVLLVTTDPVWMPAAFGTCTESVPEAVAGLKVNEAAVYDLGLTWEVSKDKSVHHYNIYSARERNAEAAQKYLIASPALPPFLDWGLKPATEYYYLITAVNRRGIESQACPVVSAKTRERDIEKLTLELDVEDKGGQSQQNQVMLNFETGVKGDYLFWARVRKERGGRDAGAAVELDGKSLGKWQIEYDQTALGGGATPASDWVWCPFLFRPLERQGRVCVEPGKHKLIVSGSSFIFSKVTITNDLSFKPEGKINTLQKY